MFWFLITILSYFFSALAALGDKYLLKGPIPNPKVYAFYVGGLGVLAVFLIPLVDFLVPSSLDLILSLWAGAIYVWALFGFFSGLKHFEASRVVPAIGGFLPLFTFGLTYLFSGGKEVLSTNEVLAFILLISGGILVVSERDKSTLGKDAGLLLSKVKALIISKSLRISVVTAFLFSLAFVLSKFVYESQTFWSGFIWMRIGGFLACLFFLFSKEVRREFSKGQVGFKPKTGIIFFSNQAVGGGAFLLQNWAIALVPLRLLAFVNALEGTKYVFLLIFTVFLSLKFPKILKERISKKILSQKLFAILLIGLGLILLASR